MSQGTKETSRPSARPGLTRGRIVGAAGPIVLAEGAEALSMRELAARLGVSAMALYNHFGDKDDLVRAVAADAFRTLKLPRSDDWREQLRLIFRALRDLYVANPALPRLIETYDLREARLFEPMELTLAALEDAGLKREAALQTYFLLIGFTMGHVAYRTGGSYRAVDLPLAVAEGRLDASDFPLSVESVTAAADWDYDKAFEVGLDTIIAGLQDRT